MLKWISSNTFFIDEFIYILCGLVLVLTGVRALKNEKNRIGTFLFWVLVGFIFAFGGFVVKYVENGGAIIGGILLFLGVLTLTKQVQMGKFNPPTDEERRKNADRIGWKIIVPSILMAILAVFFSEFKRFGFIIGVDPKTGKDIIFNFSTAQILGLSTVIALVITWIIAKPKTAEVKEDTTRLLMQVGTSSLLPQLLGALGLVFAAAGVGNIIGEIAGGIVGGGGRVAGVVVYCLGMVIFTMIMGNAFSAFSVITLGIGIPFVFSQGANVAVAGALALTAGYCGTLLTPMAANFNIMPAALLEIEDKNSIIKHQAPVALILLAIHIVLMYFLAF